jgi:hypothetical protein
MALLVACGNEQADNPAPRTTTALPTGPQLNPLERAVLERLRAVDPNAGRAEHGFNDAHATATITGDRIRIDIPSPGFGIGGKIRRTARYSGVKTQAVSTRFAGLAWRFGCRLRGFGNREVDLTSVSQARRVVPAVYRLLRCSVPRRVASFRRKARR